MAILLSLNFRETSQNTFCSSTDSQWQLVKEFNTKIRLCWKTKQKKPKKTPVAWFSRLTDTPAPIAQSISKQSLYARSSLYLFKRAFFSSFIWKIGEDWIQSFVTSRVDVELHRLVTLVSLYLQYLTVHVCLIGSISCQEQLYTMWTQLTSTGLWLEKCLWFIKDLPALPITVVYYIILIEVLPSLSTVWPMLFNEGVFYLVKILWIGQNMVHRSTVCQCQCDTYLTKTSSKTSTLQWNTEYFLFFFMPFFSQPDPPAADILMLKLNYSCYRRHLSRLYAPRVSFQHVKLCVSSCFSCEAARLTLSHHDCCSVCCCRLATDFYATTNQSSIEGQREPRGASRV